MFLNIYLSSHSLKMLRLRADIICMQPGTKINFGKKERKKKKCIYRLRKYAEENMENCELGATVATECMCTHLFL